MFGPGFEPTPPRRPHSAVLITLRLLFTALTVLSFGFLGWAAMLRIAVMRRRAVDWVLFCVSLAWEFGILVYIGTSENAQPTNGEVALIGLLVLSAIAITAYFLVFDIGYYSRNGSSGGRIPAASYTSRPTRPTLPPYGYGYPSPYTAPVQPPAQPQPPAQFQFPYEPTPGPQSQAEAQSQTQATPEPTPQRTPARTPPRIDQVRAELDELSDILRKEQEDRAGREDRNGRNDR